MKLNFSIDDIREYSVGAMTFVNDGSTIEVDQHLGEELLKAVHVLDGRPVPVFLKSEEEETEPTPEQLPQPPDHDAVTPEVASLMSKSRSELNDIAIELEIDPTSFGNKLQLAVEIAEKQGE